MFELDNKIKARAYFKRYGVYRDIVNIDFVKRAVYIESGASFNFEDVVLEFYYPLKGLDRNVPFF